MKPTGLYHKIISVQNLDTKTIHCMFDMMENYYANTTWENFENDLHAKTVVVCIFNSSSDELVGFSTAKEFFHTVDGSEIVILYSGDTIIQQEYWGSQRLVLGFSEYMASVISRYKDHEVFWFLISKGIRTYKYLPTFFKEYYPSHLTPTPERFQRIIDSVATLLFPKLFHKSAGIIRFDNGQYLKSDFIPKSHPSSDIEKFYFSKNPGHVKGDELVCLTSLRADNFRDRLRNIIFTKYAQWKPKE